MKMTKIIKTTISIVMMAGMLGMSAPAFVFAEERPQIIDPGELIAKEDLPDDAMIARDVEQDEIYVYIYDDDGNLVPVEPVFEQPESGKTEVDDPENDELAANDLTSGDHNNSGQKDLDTDLNTQETEETRESKDSVDSDSTEPKSFGPLTPEGNLTLIDDYGSETKSGKQFITVQTKSGKYFYIIIDRDDNGTETVHFLNQVDEEDILAYMEEEAVNVYEERKSALEEKKAALLAEEEALKAGNIESEPGQDLQESQTIKTDKKAEIPKLNSSSLLIVIVIAAVGIGGLVYVKVIKKKKPVNGNTPELDDDDWDDEAVDNELAEIPDETEDTDE